MDIVIRRADAPAPFGGLRALRPVHGTGFRSQRPAIFLVIAAAHAWAAWLLLEARLRPPTPVQAAPLTEVFLLGAVEPAAATAPIAALTSAVASPDISLLPIVQDLFPVDPEPVAPLQEAAPSPNAPSASPSTPVSSESVAALSTAVPVQIPPSAVQYQVPPQPDYPRASRKFREAGRVIVRVYVDEQGLPRTVQVRSSSGFPRLDEAALAAVQRARFRPYTLNGQPTAGWALVPLDFGIDS